MKTTGKQLLAYGLGLAGLFVTVYVAGRAWNKAKA